MAGAGGFVRRPGINALYPLRVSGPAKSTIWGGARLRELYGKTVAAEPIGETWEVCEQSQVDNGPLAGETLDSLLGCWGAALVGARAETAAGHFPLLAKLIDARDRLSLQVHPDDAAARRLAGDPWGKTEAWYVLDVDPDAGLWRGLSRAVTAAEFRTAVETNTVEALLECVRVRPGDVVFVPAGTLHAIGGGLVLFEIQQHSDLTYRVTDWGRLGSDGKPRRLHLDEALAVARLAPNPPALAEPVELPWAAGQRRLRVACPYFALDELALAGEATWPLDGGAMHLLLALDGTVTVRGGGVETTLAPGQMAVVPAGLDAYTVAGQGARLLRCWQPDLAGEILAPLAAAGLSPEAMRARGWGL